VGIFGGHVEASNKFNPFARCSLCRYFLGPVNAETADGSLPKRFYFAPCADVRLTIGTVLNSTKILDGSSSVCTAVQISSRLRIHRRNIDS